MLLIALLLATPLLAQQSGGSTERFVRLRSDGNGIAAFATMINVSLTRLRVEDALQRLLSQVGVGVVYDRDLPGLDQLVTLRAERMRAAEVLLRVLRDTPLELRVAAGGQAVLVRRSREDQRGSISGIIREQSGDPVSSVRVRITGTGLGTLSDADGRFMLRDVPSGLHELRALRIGFRSAQIIDVSVETDETVELEIALERAPTPLAAVVVTPGYFGVMETSQLAARASLTREEIETNPQLGEDIFRAVTRLPGVTSYDISAAFRVRGGANSELLVRMDGLDLLEPFHLKDFDAALSIIDVAAIGGIDLTTGGFGAQFGDRLTGVFDMRTIEAAGGRPKTALALTLTNLRAMSQGTFGGGDRGSWLFSARRGYIDYALKLSDAREDISPRYYDVLGKVEFRVSDAHVISGHVLHAGDRTRFKDEEFDPTLRSSYGNSYGWLNWKMSSGAGLDMRTVLSVGRLSWRRAGERTSFVDNFTDLIVRDVRKLDLFGGRSDWSWQFARKAMVKWGFEARHMSATYDYFSAHRRLFVVADTIAMRFDTTDTKLDPDGWATAAYVAQRVQPWSALTAELGVRYDRHEHTGDDDLSPRINIAYTVGSRATLRAAWGEYRQAQGIHQIQVQDGETGFHRAERAEQRVLGLDVLLPRGVMTRLEAYERRISSPRPRFENLGNPLTESFPEVLGDRRLLEPDRADAKGIELFVKQTGGSAIDWSASYALASARDHLDGRWSPKSIDQRHTFYLDAAYRPSPKWRFSVGWQYHTGWPYTPFTFRVDTLSNGSVAVDRVFGERNSARLAPYHRLDTRATRNFATKHGRISVFLDLFNVYNRRNVRAIDYFISILDNGRRIDTRTQEDELIPRLPSFGVIWEF
jgi:hypothetical protein